MYGASRHNESMKPDIYLMDTGDMMYVPQGVPPEALEDFDPITAGIMAVTSLGSAAAGLWGQKSAADQQLDFQREQIEEQRRAEQEAMERAEKAQLQINESNALEGIRNRTWIIGGAVSLIAIVGLVIFFVKSRKK